ncbi:MAG: hypothetical protein WAL26_18650, partial [Mycobacterium sp.]
MALGLWSPALPWCVRAGVGGGATPLAVGIGAFPAIIDTAVAVSTLMLLALGDKPARRTRT